MFKRCTQCGAEYQRTVERCVDCGGALEHSVDPLPAPMRPAGVSISPSSELVQVRVADPWWLEELAEALQRAGIGSRIDSDPPGDRIANPEDTGEYGRSGTDTRVALYVRESDHEAARRVDHEMLARRTPDLAPLGDPADSSACPACGVALSPDAAECASCGLAFPEA